MDRHRKRFPTFVAARFAVAAGLIPLALVIGDSEPNEITREAVATAPSEAAKPSVVPTKRSLEHPRFIATIRLIGPETIARMGTSWRPGCPVPLEDLRSIVMPFWSFGGAVETGELIVHEQHASDVAGVFRQLFETRFPIERMEPANGYMGNDPPLAQRNNTVGFNCRAPVGGGGRTWSEHSYGSAVDINPDRNPYVSRTGRVEPPFGRPFVDRALDAPGMIAADHLAVRAFRAIGWRWGGFWRGTKDYMHFSASGR